MKLFFFTGNAAKSCSVCPLQVGLIFESKAGAYLSGALYGSPRYRYVHWLLSISSQLLYLRVFVRLTQSEHLLGVPLLGRHLTLPTNVRP
jgi:hypothetical protein